MHSLGELWEADVLFLATERNSHTVLLEMKRKKFFFSELSPILYINFSLKWEPTLLPLTFISHDELSFITSDYCQPSYT